MPRTAWITALTLALPALACSGGGGGSSPTAPSPPGGGSGAGKVVTVEVVDDAYSPQSVIIEAGDTVRWVMQGSHAGHTVTARNGEFDSGFAFQGQGDSFEHTFTAAASGRTFEYFCSTHKDCCQMQGSVRVGEDAPLPSPGY